MAGSDSGIATRTWQNAIGAITDTKHIETKSRGQRAAKEKAFDLIRRRVIVETPAELLLEVLKAGITVRSADRATEFKQRCNGLGIEGASLHSYRYAWAERARSVGP